MSVSGPTKWWQLRVLCDRSKEPAIQQLLATLPTHAISCLDAEDTPIFGINPEDQPLWDRLQILVLLDRELTASERQAIMSLKEQQVIEHWSMAPLTDQDWQAPCEKEHEAMCFGGTLWVCPSWSPPPSDAKAHMTLDPGLAFGTGRHPTTQLCLSWLAHHDLSGQTVIDFGCGSGILGIAAVQCGASDVHAIDHDPQALIATQQNAQNNHCDTVIHAHPSSEHLPDQLGDVVVANILLNPIIELKPILFRLLKPSGTLIVSGILHDQCGPLIDAMQPLLRCATQNEQDGWALCVFEKASPN